MSYKRTRAFAQIDESQSKFHYEEVKVRYGIVFKNQQMHPKKGFTLKESNYIDFMARIRQVAVTLNWELFCEKRPSMNDELVCEFYANLTSSELKEVSVCGIKVPITSNVINEFFELPDFKNDEYYSIMSNTKPENLQKILKELTVPGSKWTVSKQGIYSCRKEYLTPLAKTIDVGKIILREMRNCAFKRSGPAYFPVTITILCFKAKILTNVKKTSYSQGTITDWDLYQIARDSFEDPEEEEEDPTEIEPMQSADIHNRVEPMEPKAKPDVENSMLRAQPPRPDLRDELSKLMDIMQHIQWQQQAYWRYLKIRDDFMRSAFTKRYNDPFIFVPAFPDFIFEPWSPQSKRERSDSCKNKDDGAKYESNSEGSANK
ncbi:hypothetical protein PVK06_030177 [Gossypium arboreum]|uniref:Putative plant transposon protein domain-containing protein n=1 Tax=Gossypium arboreum TaxID=29729 RepID=A0ABR0NMK3_GOSAR|nr:hypothetical protein PVK06_030177 [Gossypium arboreum]